MNRPGRCCFVFFLLTAASAPAADPPANKEKAAEKWLIDRAMTLSPQAQPRLALRYRLLPTFFDRKPGNAVPIYLRLVHQQNDASRRLWVDVPTEWNKLPLRRLPLEEARKFFKQRNYMVRQLDLGARRQKAEWEYTLDAGNPIELLLPDMQNMRNYVPMLVLRARVALAEKNYPDAVRALETGFAFSQHIAEAPFLISGLVAVAASNIFADAVLEFVEQPGAPNLYWALTALPRPLIGLRKGEDFEYTVMHRQFPDLADLERARTVEQWDEALKRVRTERNRLTLLDREAKPLPAGTTPDEPASKSPDLATARRYLTEQRKLPAERVKEMPPAQVLMLWMAATFQDFSDDVFKTTYLPFVQSRPLFAAANKRLKADPDDEGHRLAKWLLPAMGKVRLAQNRLDRRIAALRVIEALRMHAAAHGGKLPDKLADVTVVPVPNDPGTGKPFAYQRDGGTATLSGTLPGEPLEHNGLRYRLTIR
jgi:hypothetical protein